MAEVQGTVDAARTGVLALQVERPEHRELNLRVDDGGSVPVHESADVRSLCLRSCITA